MTRVTKLTHKTLLELLDFDPVGGIFLWKIARSNRVKIGSRAGVFHPPSGGRYISIDGEKFMAHRLAWFYVHGEWPEHDIRPLDGNYDNAAITNLEQISRVILQHRRLSPRTNTSGHQGVSGTASGKWQSKITWNYHQISLGANFETAEEAGAAYQVALEALKTASSEDDIKLAVVAFRLEKRQRAAWNNLQRSHPEVGWKSFEDFCHDVTEVPVTRYAMSAIDSTAPIGPHNFRWSLPLDATDHTGDGHAAYVKKHREATKDQTRDRAFRKNYGINFADYQRMLIEQKGVCAICEQPETKVEKGSIRMLSVDHNHKTGVVRGLLCANCNLAVGYACDSVDILGKAITYLRKHDHGDVVVPFGKETG